MSNPIFVSAPQLDAIMQQSSKHHTLEEGIAREAQAMLNTDPKGEVGKTKAPMWLLPPFALTETAWVHGLGATKYGAYNWRKNRVCQSTYVSAIMRHLMAYSSGETVDPESRRSHLAHIVASCNILMDAGNSGTLEVDLNP